MKSTLLLLTFIPAMAFAQMGNNDRDGQSKSQLKVHYEKISMHQDNMTLTNTTNEGDMTIMGEDVNVDGPIYVDMRKHGKSKNKKEPNDWVIVADKVQISTASNPVSIKADMLSYNSKTQTGVLLGHVTIVENGATKQIGKRAEVDFCNDEYRIVSVR